MGLVSKIVKMKWHPKTKKHYESLGYIFTKYGDEFEVKVEDLTKGSEVKVDCLCDCCKKPLPWKYCKYIIHNKNGKTYCNECANKLYARENARKTKLKNGKSFYDLCIERNRQDLLDRWDEKLNGCSPKDVCYKTNKKKWFKCKIHPEHGSELKNINSFASKNGSSMDCKKCNSIAQYILDSFPNKGLYEIWDKEKNGDLDPWSISKCSEIKIWIKCQEKDYHGSYETTPEHLSRGVRCSYCGGKKVHPLDSLGQYIIDNYGEEFLWKIWSDKNEISPFEVSVYSQKKVWWNCPDNKHKSFKRSCHNSSKLEFRCPKCVEEKEESIIEEKTRLYLEELGYKVKTEYSCTIIPINPKTGRLLPFDNEIILENEKHLIIEVHGGQHYKINNLYIKTEEELKRQQDRDKYKKDYCIQMGYEYLEIPYTAFNKKETYKKLIDNKIKEILNLNKKNVKNNKQE